LTLIVRLLKRMGVDRAIGYTLLANGWSTLSGPVTLLLLTRFLTPVEQGYSYTFSGVLASTVLFELGLSYVILQTTSHEWALLHWTPAGLLAGDERARARISSLLRTSLIWYGGISALVALLVLPGGLLFFGHYGRLHSPPGVHVAWQAPWVWLTLISVTSILTAPLMAVLEGCGLVAQISALRMRQNILGSLGMWLALTLGGGLYAAPVNGTIILLCTLEWVWRQKRGFVRDMLLRPQSAVVGHAMNWRQEVWPFQWKIALSGVSSFIIFQMFTTVLFAARGPVAAGRLGLSLSIMQTLGGIAMSWLVTKAAPFGALIARREWGRLDREFFPALWQSGVVIVSAVGLFCGLSLLLHQIGFPISRRLLEPGPMALLGGATIASHFVGAEALYLRVHRQEPFLGLSLTVAGFIGLGNMLLSKPFGTAGMMWNYFLVYLIIGVGGGTWIFVQKRRLWHGDYRSAPAMPISHELD